MKGVNMWVIDSFHVWCDLSLLRHINEDKRKTEGHTQMFEVMNDIEDVPPHLLSAHRSFIMRADMTEIGDKENGKGENFSEKGGSISMFLFSDTLEVSTYQQLMYFTSQMTRICV